MDSGRDTANPAEIELQNQLYKEAASRMVFQPALTDSERQITFIHDFRTILTHPKRESVDIIDGAKTYYAQEKQVKKQIGTEIVEQMVGCIGKPNARVEVKTLLELVDSIDLANTAGFSRENQEVIEKVVKLFQERYNLKDQKPPLTTFQKTVLTAGAALVMAGVGSQVAPQVASEVARYQAESALTVPSTRTSPPIGFTGVPEPFPEDHIIVTPAYRTTTVHDPVYGEDNSPVAFVAPPLPPMPQQGSYVETGRQAVHSRSQEALFGAEAERLIPADIRLMQNPELNRLYKLGCLDFTTHTLDGKQIMVLDYHEKPGIECNMKFPQVYEKYQVKDRISLQKVEGEEVKILVKQAEMDCAIHAYVMAALIAQEGNGRVPVVINPLLLVELNTRLTPEVIHKIIDQYTKDPAYASSYTPAYLESIKDFFPINAATQEKDVAERVLFQAFGVKLNRNMDVPYPKKEPDGNYRLQSSMFSQQEWEMMKKMNKLEFDHTQSEIVVSKDQANKIFGEWVVNWYNIAQEEGKRTNQRMIPVFGAKYYDNSIRHKFAGVGLTEIEGKQYFRVMEGLGGQMSKFLLDQGVRVENGMVLIPTDKLIDLDLGLESISFNQKSIEATKNKKEGYDRIGFRVNDLESLKSLPEGVNTVRIAGNQTELDENGNLKDKNVQEMLNYAKEKGIQVIFVYNPKWFPGQEDKPHTVAEVQKNERAIRTQINRQLRSLLEFNNVAIEIGNEADESSPTAVNQFWKGDIDTFAHFVKYTVEEARTISAQRKQLNPNLKEPRLILGAFSDPIKHEKELRRLHQVLTGWKISMPEVAIHAYSLPALKRHVEQYRAIFGKEVKLIATELNSPAERAGHVQEVIGMTNYLTEQGIPGLFHEYKFNPNEAAIRDYSGLSYAMTNEDERMRAVADFVADKYREIMRLQQSANAN